MEAVLLISLGVIGVFILFIVLKKKKHYTDYFLLLTNLSLAVMLASQIGNFSYTLTFILGEIAPLLIAASFFSFAFTLTQTLTLKHIGWLFVFPLLFISYLSYDLTILGTIDKEVFDSHIKDPNIIYLVFYKTHQLYVIGLSIWLLQRIKVYHTEIKNRFSNIEEKRVLWLKHFAIIYLVTTVVVFVAYFLYNFGVVESIEAINYIVNGFVVLGIFYLSVNGIKYYTIEENGSDKPQDVEAQKNIITNQHKDLFEEITRLFEEGKIYQEPQLKVADLAEQLNKPTHHVSQTININYGKPFFDFVSEYRINDLKEKLKNPENKKFTILAMGLECGFNSKASLNRIFKEFTGQTPSEYQRSHISK